MKKFLARFAHPIRGITYAFRNDQSYRTNVYLFGAITTGVFVLFEPLAPWETLFVILSYALILITELQNSALETALDRMHPERHDMIGQSKDMAAGAVLTAAIFLLIVLATLVYGRI